MIEKIEKANEALADPIKEVEGKIDEFLKTCESLDG